MVWEDPANRLAIGGSLGPMGALLVSSSLVEDDPIAVAIRNFIELE